MADGTGVTFEMLHRRAIAVRRAAHPAEMSSLTPVEILQPPAALAGADGKPLGPFRLAESPVWDAETGRLWCVDIEAQALHALDFDTGAGEALRAHRQQRFDFGQKVCALGLARSGRLLLALADGVYFFTPQTEALQLLARPEPDRPDHRLNDGKVGPDGAFWVGTIEETPERAPVGSLYRISADGRCRRISTGYRVSNGLAWSADGRAMFHTDSRGPTIDRWDFDPATGMVGARTTIRTLSEKLGRPDGGACDVAGGYWSAGIGAFCLNRFDFDGNLVQRVDLPEPRPTMPCFGGPDMQTLFVTSARHGLNETMLARSPDAGRLLVLRVAVAGVPVQRFADA
jgi:sugar lactone lactonase YvrE